MNQFLRHINFPRVDSLSVPKLDRPITLEEITKSINSLQSKKSPGPDGLPSEFYKKFHVKLAPLLLSVFEESLDLGKLPPTLRQASITLLPKDGKDPTLCNSYRPISLLNVDVKILAKTLASRLEVILPSIISEEQTGFIKGRYSFSNIRTLFNIVYSRQNSGSSEVIISLDAEKAFDRIEWVYLFRVLEEFGFGDGLISWIRLLCTDPQASIYTNSVNSEYFTLSRGTRQGCPLSPLLFAIAIEPLSIMLRTLPVFQGIIRKGIEYKLSLYADDLLLYVTDPIASIPELIRLLDDFGKYSGYKLNLDESEC
ncbi:LINE-1 retrotransposable element ORF2 protein [Labeo rohita]|uniref:LINE-1 retrotransposable element ORF2 protein n=1 Tax=Labeo rohita TaxID=84645 RepID=A0ABQ8L8M0_LABRO|nr:LINE-1 retrotransposable element ORF2 protein [Labeo rohita]